MLKLVRDTKQKENELDKMIGNIPVELTNEIEKLRSQYKNGEITEAEVISKLLKAYGMDEYISQPSYSAAFGKKYNPEKKRELVGKVAMALVYVKGGEAYIEEQYKEYEKRYSNNYYDRNKLTHNTSYGVLPVDNPPKIPREEYFKQLVVDEMENVGKQAYSGEKLENDLAKAASAIVDGILIQRAYNKYGQIEKPSVEDVPKTKVNNPKVLDEPEPEIKTTNGFAGSDANASGRKIITSTIGNEIDITPSSNHISVNKNPGPYGEANTSVDILDANGNIKTRRWYDSDGKAYRDVDMSDHGNPKEHPEVPHEHTWEYNNGKPKRN